MNMSHEAGTDESTSSATGESAEAAARHGPAPHAGAELKFESPAKGEDPLYDEDDEDVYEDIGDLESPLESFGSVKDAPDCGPVIDQIHERLRRDHLVILHSTDAAYLGQVSKCLVSRHFPPPRKCWSVFYKQQSWIAGRPQALSIFAILKWIDRKSEALAVMFDQHHGDESLLLSYDYQEVRGRVLRDQLEKRGQTYVLVLTLTSRFERLVSHFGATELEPLGLVLQPRSDREPVAPPAPELLDMIGLQYGYPGILSLWCMVWLGDAAADSVISCIERMLEYRHQGKEDTKDVLEAWRSSWTGLLATVGAETVDDPPSGVKLRLPGARWIEDVRGMFRGNQRMRHVESMRLLRESGVLLNADSNLLDAFASFTARLAAAEGQIGRSVLVQLVEEWLPGASREIALRLLVSVFCSLVRNENVKLASSALETLCQAGHADAAALILMHCPTTYAGQEWHLRLYDRVLPALSQDVRPLLWSRFVRIGAAHDVDLAEYVRVAHANLSAPAFAELVGRFVEEALLGSHDRRATLLSLLTSGAGRPSSPGSCVGEVIRSDAFRTHAQRRTRWWTSDGTGETLFDIWIVRTLAPLVPSMPKNRLLSLLGSVLDDQVPNRMPPRFRKPTPVDRIVAMLLVECCSERTGVGSAVDDDTRSLIRSLVPDIEGAAAVYESLRTLSDRFFRASRAPGVASLRGSSAEREAQVAIRSFLAGKAAVVKHLRNFIETTYFQGARRANQASR